MIRSLWEDTAPPGPARDPSTGHRGGRLRRRRRVHRVVDRLPHVLEHDPVASVRSSRPNASGSGRAAATAAGARPCCRRGRASSAAEHGPRRRPPMREAMRGTIDEVERVVQAEGIDCHFRRGGTVVVAPQRAAAGPGRGRGRGGRARRSPERLRLLDAEQTRKTVGMTRALGATYTPDCARIHPLRLARGLAEAVERRGGRIVEGTRATEVAAGASAPTAARSGPGTSCAPPRRGRRARARARSSRSTRSWSPPSRCPPLLGPGGSGRRGDVLRPPARHRLRPAHRRRPPRLRRPRRAVPLRLRSSRSSTGTRGSSAPARHAAGHVPGRRRGPVHPRLGAAPSASRATGTPPSGTTRDRLGSAGGYVGDGVGTANLAGRTLAASITGQDSELLRLPWFGHVPPRWEPNRCAGSASTPGCWWRGPRTPRRPSWAAHAPVDRLAGSRRTDAAGVGPPPGVPPSSPRPVRRRPVEGGTGGGNTIETPNPLSRRRSACTFRCHERYCGPRPALRTVFFTGSGLHPSATAVAVSDGRVAAVGTDTEVRDWAGPGTRTVDLAGRLVPPRLHRRPRPPRHGRAGAPRLRPQRGPRRRGRARPRRGVRRSPPRGVDLRRGLVDGGLPRRHPAPGGPRPDRPRPPRPPAEPRPPRRLGQQPGAGAGRRRRPHPRPRRRPHRARPPTAPRRGRCTRGHGPRQPLLPRVTADDLAAGLAEGQRYLHSVGVTGWQTPSSAATPATPTRRRTTCARPPTARSAPASWGPCGGRAVAPSRTSTTSWRVRRAPRAGRRRRVGPVPDDERQDHARRGRGEPDRLDAQPVPRRLRLQLGGDGLSYLDRDLLLAAVPALDAAGFDVHVHVIGDRAVRDALDAVALARRSPGRGADATTWRTCRSSTPTTCPGSPRSTSPPTPRRCGPARRSR